MGNIGILKYYLYRDKKERVWFVRKQPKQQAGCEFRFQVLHGNDNDQILTIDNRVADENDCDDDGDDDDWHVDPNRNSSEKRNRFGNANNHNLSNGNVNQNEHEMEIGIENQYANHGWDEMRMRIGSVTGIHTTVTSRMTAAMEI